MRADPTAAWAISKWDANDVIVSGLEPGESILGAAKMLIGHWSSRDLLKSGAAQIHPPLVELCVTDVGLREYAVERKLNRCTGECLLSIRFGQISASDSQVGRYPWGPKYCRLTVTLNDGSIRRYQASYSVKRATMLWKILRDHQA